MVHDLLVSERLRRWRDIPLSDRRTRIDFAQCIRDLVDEHFPDAERLVLVPDQLNTHSPAPLYEAYPPAEAKRLTDKLDIHCTNVCSRRTK